MRQWRGGGGGDGSGDDSAALDGSATTADGRDNGAIAAQRDATRVGKYESGLHPETVFVITCS